jgi:hypothetical protein
MALRKRLRIIGWCVGLFVLSGPLSLYAVGTSAYWNFIKRLPEPLNHFVGETLIFLTKPILVENIHDSEEQLDFYQAWLYCAVATWILCLFAFLILRKPHAEAKGRSIRDEV